MRGDKRVPHAAEVLLQTPPKHWNGGGGGGATPAMPLFGPTRFTRTHGLLPDAFIQTIAIPAWATSPYKLRILNGEPNGSHRVILAAYVEINDHPVAGALDFILSGYTIERWVTVTPGSTATLKVVMWSLPGSYLTISLHGTNADTQPPAITVTSPPANTVLTTATPELALTYADTPAGSAPASGVDQSTFKATVDGIDRTNLFTKSATGASWTVPSSLALSDGAHDLNVEVKDRAGNRATAARSFSIQTTVDPPTITLQTPPEGAIFGTSPVTVTGTVQEHAGGAVTMQCRVGENTVSAQVTGQSFTCAVPVVEGDNAIYVSATDTRNQTVQVARSVRLDATTPTLTITAPADHTYTTAETIAVSGTVVDASAVTVTVNGQPAPVVNEQFEVPALPVGNGPTFPVTVVVVDAAGNRAESTVTVNVVRTPLTVAITSPAPNAVLRGPMVAVTGTTSQNLPVDVDVNGEPATVANGEFTAQVPLVEGTQTIRATARDAAGRTETAEITVRIDTIAPAITLNEPASGTITNAQEIRVAGTVTDPSEPTLKINDTPVTLDAGGAFSILAPLTAEGPITLTLVATDSVNNSSSTTVDLVVDRTAPQLTVASPTPGEVMSALPIVVQGTVADATETTITVDGSTAERTVDAWQASFPTLPDGPHEFTIVATDAAGNATTKTVAATLDTAAPAITIVTPAPGTITRSATVDVTGTVTDISAVSVVVGGVAAAVTGTTFAATGVSLGEGDGDKTLVAIAKDATNRTSEASVVVTRDTTAPDMELTAPERATRREAGRAVATVTDAFGVAQVVFAIQGQHVATQTEAPFGIDLVVPEAAAIGGTFGVTATATDRAGNVSTAAQTVRVGADGAIVGQVLTDATGLPLPDATVRFGDQTRTTDAQGRYTLPTDRASVSLRIEKAGMTAVSRVVSTTVGTGAVPVDARLTPLAAPVTITSGAAVTLTAQSTDLVTTREEGSQVALPSTPGAIGSIAIDVPASAVSSDVAARLTPLSAQGLPELLPLGWSPIVAFDLRAEGTIQGALPLRVTLTAPVAVAAGGTLTLVQYRELQHAWTVVAREVTVSDALVAAASLPGVGVFALVLPDTLDPPIVVPAESEPLTGVNVQELPITAASRGLVEPGVIPPTGGVARGQVLVDTPAPLPSGTLVQAEIAETFTLPSGQVASEESRRADLVLYRLPRRALPAGAGATPTTPESTALGAAFPIAPSRTFNPADLIEGRVHLDILAGRESVRGVTGGREAVTVTSDNARIVVPAGALGEDIAVTMTRGAFSEFLPDHAALTSLAELVVDLAGRTLTLPAELSIDAASAGATPGSTFVIARVERIGGVPALEVVAFAEISGDRLVAQPVPGLAGVTQGGRFVFYRVAGELGFVGGSTRSAMQPLASVVSSDTLPFVARSGSDGRYLLVTLEGSTTLRARVPFTSFETQGSVTVAADQTATLDLLLAAAVTNATVTPANDTRGVARHAQITVATSAPINIESLGANSVRLSRLDGSTTTSVTVRTVLAGSGMTLSVVPVDRLEADRDYRLEVSGLTDTFGGVIVVPPTTFHTAADAPPTYTLDSLVFSFPDADGIVTASAAAGSFPAGVQFLVINSTSGEVLSFGVQNDGSVSERIAASLDDRLVITITDPDGRATTLTRSQFFDASTGRTAIGPGGGVVEGPGGIGLRIPEGAVSRAVLLKLSPMEANDFPTKPDVPGALFGSALKVEASGDATFTKEVDLVFPVPAGALTAAQEAGVSSDKVPFYAYRRIIGDDGEPIFTTLDWAKIEGTGDDARVATQSFPFSALLGAVTLVHALVLYLLPGRPLPGAITGHVLRPVFDPGAATPRYIPVENALVIGVDASGNPLEPRTGATTQKDGRYTLTDHRFTSGQVQVETMDGGTPVRQFVTVMQRGDTKAQQDAAISALFKNTFFSNVGTANLTLSPEQPAPPAPVLTVRVMKMVDGKRVDTGGLVVGGTPLIVGVSDTSAQPAFIRGLSIKRPGSGSPDGDPLAIMADPALQPPRQPLAMDVITSEELVLTQPGAYTLEATALPAFGPAVTASVTIRVLGAGGGIETDNAAAPAVITAQTIPRADARGVPVTIFPQVAFTEPVRNIPGQVRLVDANGVEVPLRISGVGVDQDGQPIAIEHVTNVTTVVTSLTLQPLLGLSYGMKYQIVLTDAIVDLDTTPEGASAPKPLVAFESAFTTFGPEPLGGTDEFAAPGLVVLSDRAYILESFYRGGVGGQQTGQLRVFEVTDPVQPREIAPPTAIGAPPRDIGGEGQTVAVVTNSVTAFVPGAGTSVEIASGPANILVYDVTDATPVLTGAASLTNGIIDGFPNRVVVRDGVAYVATARKGIQVVDLSRTATDIGLKPSWEQNRDLFAPNAKVNPTAVVATIAVTDPASPHPSALVNDLKVGDYLVEGASHRLVLATGAPETSGLVVVNPAASTIVHNGALVSSGGALTRGEAIALARLANRDVAIVGGYGVAGGAGAAGVIAIVDLSPLASIPKGAPAVLAWFGLTHGVGDILILDQTAIVSSPSTSGSIGVATLINLADPLHPQLAGMLTGVGSRLGLANGVLTSTNRSYLSGLERHGGLRTTAIGEAAIIAAVRPDPIVVSAGDEVFTDVELDYRAIPWDPSVATAEIKVRVLDGATIATLPGALVEGRGTVTWPKGAIVDTTRSYTATAHIQRDGGEMRAYPRRLRFDKVPLALTTRDRLLRIQFALPTQGMFASHRYGVRVYMAAQNGSFSSTPAFSLSAQDIENAYPNEDQWWPADRGSAAAAASWVTRKIDKMELPPGMSVEIHRQAFEIGAVLAGYPKVKVVVVSETANNRELAVQEGMVTPDGDWTMILSRVQARVQAAAGMPVADDPTPPPPVFEPTQVFTGMSGLVYRAAYSLIEAEVKVGVQFLNGMVTGFIDGLKGDRDTVAMVGQTLAHPIESAKAFWAFCKELKNGFTSLSINGMLQSVTAAVGGTKFPPLDVQKLRQAGAYYAGYLLGYVIEQVLVTIAIGVVTVGVGALVAKAATLTRAGLWVASMAKKAMAALRSLAYGLEKLADLAADTNGMRRWLSVIRRGGDTLDLLWAKYPDATALLKRLAETSTRVSVEAAETALKWLTVIDRMSDAGAQRVIVFIERHGGPIAERWFNKLMAPGALTNGRQSMARGFEAVPSARDNDLPLASQHWLVATADVNSDAAAKLVTKLSPEQLDEIAARLTRDIDDVRVTERVKGQLGTILSDPDVPPMSADTAEDFGWMLMKECVVR